MFFLTKVLRQGIPLTRGTNGVVTSWDTTTRPNLWSSAMYKYPVKFTINDHMDFQAGVPQGKLWCVCHVRFVNFNPLPAGVKTQIRNNVNIIQLPTLLDQDFTATERDELIARLDLTDLSESRPTLLETPRIFMRRLAREALGLPDVALTSYERD